MKSIEFTINWQDIQLQNWSTEHTDTLMQQSTTCSFSGVPVPPEGEVLRMIIDEDLLDELQWQHSFARSLDVLEQMANDALADRDAGHTKLLDLNDL